MVNAMGSGFLPPEDGVSVGTNFYGLGRAYAGNFGMPAWIGHAYGVWQQSTLQTAIGTGIWTSGNVYAAGFYENSSRTLKRDIALFKDDAGEILDTLRIVNFRYKVQESEYDHIGIIA